MTEKDVILTAGLLITGLFVLLVPGAKKYRKGYRVVERGMGIYFFRLIGLGMIAAGVFLGGLKLWRAHQGSFSKDVSTWQSVGTTDGVLQVLLPPSREGDDSPSAPGFTAWSSPAPGVAFGLAQSVAGPGVGFTQPTAVLQSVQKSASFSAEGLDKAKATILQQQPVSTSGVQGLRVGLEIPPTHRFFSQQYHLAGKSYTVVMFAPTIYFQDGTAKAFFDTISLRPPTTAPQPRLNPSGLGQNNRAPAKDGSSSRHFESKPGMKRVGD
jgi:hypothetical protein